MQRDRWKLLASSEIKGGKQNGSVPSSSNDHTRLIIDQRLSDGIVRRVLQQGTEEIGVFVANLVPLEHFQEKTWIPRTFFLLTTSAAAHWLNSPIGPWYVKASMMVSKYGT